ncbi:MAG: O-methyltransferase [Bacillota bacterium]|nr:O-methyltransferase [Bacillota bacterium]
MDTIVPSYLEEYLRSLLPQRDELLASLEKEAADTNTYAPIIEPEVAQLLRTLVMLKKPKRILELGTSIGYSAIVMAQYMDEDGELITVERYSNAASRAGENIKKAHLENIIKVVEEEAVTALSWLDGCFDMIFLDAAKGQYSEFLPYCLKLLKPGGIIVSDDVLYKGEVTDAIDTEKRKVTIVKRMNEYLKLISGLDGLTTSVLPIGNGVAISVKE